MVYFSNVFDIDAAFLESYGAFDISLINDLPLFIDPFLLFGSDKPEYQELHKEILRYISFLKSKSQNVTEGQLYAWYMFPEIKQNWLGYSLVGNGGRGLGIDFALSFSANLDVIFDNLGNEKISMTSHLEKACLFNVGIGRDNISDFTTNLIYPYLLDYSEAFALQYLEEHQCKKVNVAKAYFNYVLERWMPNNYTLPCFDGDFILLTPKDLLTKDDTWINRNDLTSHYSEAVRGIPNSALRAEIDNYLRSNLPAPTPKKKGPTSRERAEAITKVLQRYPQIIDYYIRMKEKTTGSAKNDAQLNVAEIQNMFIGGVTQLIEELAANTEYFKKGDEKDSYTESLKRGNYLKQVIENNDGYRIFYHKGNPIKREADIQIIFRLTWYSTKFDVNSEVNNGRGPVDYKVSDGSKDNTLIEFKLASNSKLKQNLASQVKVYEAANQTKKSIKIILYFSPDELMSVNMILKELKIEGKEDIILINAGRYNKQSASNVK